MYNDSFKERYGKAPVAISETRDLTPTNPHIHNEIEILYILKGGSVVKISDKEFNAKAGDLFFINPLEVHSVTVKGENGYHHKCICFDSSLISDGKIRQDLLDGVKAADNAFDIKNFVGNELYKYTEAIYKAVEEQYESLLFDANGCII